MSIPASFNAFRIHHDDHGHRSGIEQVRLDDLSSGEVVIRTAYSSVNFKVENDAVGSEGLPCSQAWMLGPEPPGEALLFPEAAPAPEAGAQACGRGSGVDGT